MWTQGFGPAKGVNERRHSRNVATCTFAAAQERFEKAMGARICFRPSVQPILLSQGLATRSLIFDRATYRIEVDGG